MVITADPQYDWGCSSGHATSDYCNDPNNRSKSVEQQAIETNSLQVETIQNLQTNINAFNGNFKGVIINGDLTDFGSQNNHLNVFKSHYENKGFNLWPGLGNHDYENNVDDCGGLPYAWAAWNYCECCVFRFV